MLVFPNYIFCVLVKSFKRNWTSSTGHWQVLLLIGHLLLTIHSRQMQDRCFWLNGSCSPLSGVVTQLGGFHLLVLSMGSTSSRPYFGPEMVPMHPSYARPFIIWTKQYCAKNSVVHRMNGRACAKGIRIYLLPEKALATLLTEWSTVDDSLKKVIKTRFVFLHDIGNTATLYDLKHSIVLHHIGVLLITRDWERLIWSNCEFSTSSRRQTFCNIATWWLTYPGAQCNNYDTIPTPCVIPSICTISSGVPTRDAQPGKHNGTRWGECTTQSDSLTSIGAANGLSNTVQPNVCLLSLKHPE